MPHLRCNWVDIFFITLLFRTCYVGLKNGILPEIFKFAGLFIAFIFSFTNYTVLSQFLSEHTHWTGASTEVVSFLFIFFATLFLFKIIALLAKTATNQENMSGFNRGLGLALGFIRGVLLVSLIYALFANSPFEYLSKSSKERSFSSHYVSRGAYIFYAMGSVCFPWNNRETPLVKLINQ